VRGKSRHSFAQIKSIIKSDPNNHGLSQSQNSREKIVCGFIPVAEILNFIISDRYIGKSEAASYLGMSLRTLQSQLSQIPHYRRGGKILFKLSELDRWMQQYRESSHSLDGIIEDTARNVISGWKGSRPGEQLAPAHRGDFTREQFERAKPFLSQALRDRLEAQLNIIIPQRVPKANTT
jgi:excisionase family DNA binding protein